MLDDYYYCVTSHTDWSRTKDNDEIVDLIGISESDLLSVVSGSVSVARGTMPSDEDIVVTITEDGSDVEEDEDILNVIISVRYAKGLKAYINNKAKLNLRSRLMLKNLNMGVHM
ncbi:2452_t:CDS:2 [Paraglomus occultum]|uniref:2452_t:CDS:1 n=1 Tax=Paraglomus occultum TaxID=144539 RepID=A0A9N9C1L5_9GLOM|nr:2452_t:CDS:2 [Paraglomus occultum]